MNAIRRLPLHHQILLAMLVGAGVGLPLNHLQASGAVSADAVSTVASIAKGAGDIFLRLLQMLVVPLIVSSLITGVAKMGNLRKLGRLGGRTFVFYMFTSALAIATGLLFVNLISPGSHAELSLLEAQASARELPSETAEPASLGTVLWNQLIGMIPKNPLKAAAEGDMLPIIFFSLLLGVFISLGEHGEETEEDERDAITTLRKLFEGLFAVMMRMTLAVIALAPIGVLGFMLHASASHGTEAFRALGLYALTVALGLFVHAAISLPLILKFVGGGSPSNHFRAMRPALLTAFSTASSNGTLPLTMRSVEESGVREEVSAFVLPLGATINMDGTALYEVVAVLFIAQVHAQTTGFDLTLSHQIVIALTALLASIGAAGIPHAGVVMMVVVLSAVGLPTSAVGLILAVDRVLDMARTTVNVWSDSIAASVVNELTRDEPAPVEVAG